MKILTEQLESENLNIFNAILIIESCIKSLNQINEDESQLYNIINRAKLFSEKIDVDADADFIKYYRKRFLPKKLIIIL